MRYKEIILAVTMLFGFIVAEMPSDVRDYTQTGTKYSLDNYGGTIAANHRANTGDDAKSVTG